MSISPSTAVACFGYKVQIQIETQIQKQIWKEIQIHSVVWVAIVCMFVLFAKQCYTHQQSVDIGQLHYARSNLQNGSSRSEDWSFQPNDKCIYIFTY